MRLKDMFARGAGGAVGVAVAMTVPHLGCLAALTPLAVGTGIGASGAVSATYAAGAMLLAGGGVAAYYGLRPSREACCIIFGETGRVRFRKAMAVTAFAFVAAATVNTWADNGLSLETRAEMLESVRGTNMSIWQQQEQLNLICGTRRFAWN